MAHGACTAVAERINACETANAKERERESLCIAESGGTANAKERERVCIAESGGTDERDKMLLSS